MYFCPNCSYSFDINKSSKVSKEVDTRKPIKKVADVLNKLENNEDLSKYKAEFSKEELAKNKKYQKLKEDDKIKINQTFDEMVSSGAEFKCNNCNFTKQIGETTLLYSINMEDKVVKIKTLEENELICKDPLLPHTQDYTCKNPSCITHKNTSLKDAIFYKERGSYKVIYVCAVCNYSW
jgi:uncharacterized Zn finger protein (UPF0148 family)